MSDALGTDYIVELESAEFFLMARAVNIGGITISSARHDHVFFQADTLRISGIGLQALTGRAITVSTLRMSGFVIDMDDTATGSNEGTNQKIERVAIEDLDLTAGTIIIRDSLYQSTIYNEVNLKAGFDISFRNDSLSTSPYKVHLNADSLGFIFSKDRYRLSLINLIFSEADSSLSFGAFKLFPIGGVAKFYSLTEYRSDVYDFNVENFRISGFDSPKFHHENIFNAHLIDCDILQIYVTRDLTMPSSPVRRKQLLLNEAIQNLPFGLQVNRLAFNKTDIKYSEVARDGFRPGTVSFMNSTIIINGVNSLDPSPAILTGVTYLQNHSQLNTELRFNLDDGPFLLTGTGSLNTFNLTQLNSIFMDLEGVQIENGTAHETSFAFQLTDSLGTGNMHMHYDNLKIKLVSKDDYSNNSLGGRLRSFFADKIVIRASNLPNDDGEIYVGKIENPRNPEHPFFKYLWETLRSGIFDIVIRI